jgi:integrase
MAYVKVPALMAKLRDDNTIGAKALEFCILTATRTGEVLGARWYEIDLAANVWTLPADRTKAAREHRVPLSGRARAILEELWPMRSSPIIFQSPRGARPLSHVAMAKLLARQSDDRATVHGFRSSFRDWVGNETHFPREVAEAALAHVIGDKSEQAYRRSDALEKRRKLMNAWAEFCSTDSASKNAKVVGLREKIR